MFNYDFFDFTTKPDRSNPYYLKHINSVLGQLIDETQDEYVYEDIKKKYNPDKDEDKKLYRKILDFYGRLE